MRRKKKVFQDILYAQCWEDPQIDREAFNISNDDIIFSITSGGCNVLTFLLDNPRKIISLDFNAYQNYLLDLKISAIKNLSYEQSLEFFGIKRSRNRWNYYLSIRTDLRRESRNYWDNNKKKIEKGIIHCGRYEKFMRLLKKVILTPIIRQSVVKKFFEIEDAKDREKLFKEKFKNIRWWFLTRVMLSRAFNSFFFDKAFFANLEENFSFGKHFAGKVERAFTHLSIKDNYFLAYILLGNFLDEEHLPYYLRKANYEVIKKRLNRIEIITDSCEHYFQTLADSSITKFNFTNIFEWLTEEQFYNLLKETIRVAKNKAIITYRNLLVLREHPGVFDNNIISHSNLAKKLHEEDLSFIYNNYVIEEINKDIVK